MSNQQQTKKQNEQSSNQYYEDQLDFSHHLDNQNDSKI